MDKIEDSPTELSFPTGFRQGATELVQKGSRVIRVFSVDLRADVYADDEFVTSLSAMIRMNRRSEAKIIVMRGAALSSRSHGLLELCRQLPSLCQIKVLEERPDRYREDYLLSDRQGLIARKGEHENTAWFAPHDRINVAARIEYFDQLWHRAKENPEFRRLTI